MKKMSEPTGNRLRIGSTGPVSRAFRHQNVSDFSEALEWAHHLPYGRNTDRADYMLIFAEGHGTCSTKHAALAVLCCENDIQSQLQVAICRLDTGLDPNVASLLDKLKVEFFPEAHCYLKYAGKDIDVTFPDQSPVLKAEVLQSYPIQSDQIGTYKLGLHQEYLRQWLKEEGLDKRFSFDEVWRLREEWIGFLSS